MFVRVIPETVIDEIPFLIFLQSKLSPASTIVSLFKFLAPISFDSFAIELTNYMSPLLGLNTSGRINSSDGLTINPPNYTILNNGVFENFVLANEAFAKALRIFETCLSVNNNLCGKLVSSLELPIKFDERFKATSAPIFIPDFNLLSCELDNFIFKVLY